MPSSTRRRSLAPVALAAAGLGPAGCGARREEGGAAAGKGWPPAQGSPADTAKPFTLRVVRPDTAGPYTLRIVHADSSVWYTLRRARPCGFERDERGGRRTRFCEDVRGPALLRVAPGARLGQ
jgi:hypothetical protein